RYNSTGKAPEGTGITYLDNIQSLSGKARQHYILSLTGHQLPPDSHTELARHEYSHFLFYTIMRDATKKFEWTLGKLDADLSRAATREDVQAIVKARIKPLIQAKSRDFDFAMQELTSDRIQKYRLKYILAKIAQYLDQLAWKEAGDTQQLRHYLDKKLEIEH